MPKIDSFRIINVDYDNKAKKINDLYIKMNGKNTNIIIANGSGKTFIISLLFQTIIPGHVSAEGRDFETMLKDIEGTAHIAICHTLDNNKKLITGFAAKKTDRINYYNYTIEIPLNYTLKDIKYIKENGEVVEYNEFKDYLEKNKEVYNIKLFPETLKSEYRKYLESYRIFKSEWEMMSRTNKIEGGISEFISSSARKNTEKLLSQFIIPNITYSLKNKKINNEIAETFKNQIDNIRNLPIWEKQIEDGKKILKLFSNQINKLRELYDLQKEIHKKVYTLFEINKLLKQQKSEYENILIEKENFKFDIENEIEEISQKLINIKNGYLLYSLETSEKKLEEIIEQRNKYEKKISGFEEKINLKNALEEYFEYNELNSELNIISEEIEQKNSNVNIQEEIKKISSKLYDYYHNHIKNIDKKLLDTEFSIKNIELKHINLIKEISEKNNELKKIKKDIEYLNQKLSQISKIIDIEKNNILNKEINEKIKLKDNLEKNIEDLKIKINKEEKKVLEIENLSDNLKNKIKEIKKEYKEFKKNHEDIIALKKLYSINSFKMLYIKINDELRKMIIKMNTAEKQLNSIEILIDKIDKNKFIPIPETIEKIDYHLQNKNFYDYTIGYSLLKNNIENFKNPLLLNSIVVQEKDIKKLEKKLKNFDLNTDIVFIQTREDINKFEINDGICKFGIQIIMNDYHKFISGEISIEELKEKYISKKEKIEKNLENIKEDYDQINQYQNIIVKFQNIYGNDDEKKKKEFENILEDLNSKYKEELLNISRTKEKIEIYKNKLSDKRKQLIEVEIKLRDFQKKQNKLNEIQNAINDRFGINLYQIKEYLKRLAKQKNNIEDKIVNLKNDIEEINENRIFLNKEKENLIIKKAEYSNDLSFYEKNKWKYENEDIQSLKSKYEYLIQEIDTRELYNRKEKIQKKINKKLIKIKKYNYTFETLEYLKNTELKSEEYYRNNIKKYRNIVDELNRNTGILENEINSLKTKITNYNVPTLTEEMYIELNSKYEEELTTKKELYSKLIEDINKTKNILEQIIKDIKTEEELLQNYKKPEKQIITDFEIFKKEELHNSFIKTLKQLKILEDNEKEKRNQISDGWQEMKLLISEEGFDLIVNMGFLYEKTDFKYDYETSKSLYYTVKDIIDKKINTLISYKEKAMRFKREMIKNILSEITLYISTLKKLSKFSEIIVEDQKLETIKILLNRYNEEDVYNRISDYIDEIIKIITNNESNNFKENEEIRKYINTSFSIFNLLKITNGAPIKIKILKPDKSFENPRWYFLENVSSWSGGEKFFAFFAIYISITKVMKNNIGGSMIIIADNPFGKASSEHILSPLMILMKKNNAQFITFTAHNDVNISKYFNYNYSLVLVKSTGLSNILKISRKQKTETFEKGYYVEW
ncbi:Chromosome segregation ATPase [Marinitoga hydrogenitolerans DSM 16785]|uniref:Chromosome segregation ATPase n=1 Tax=Marinitoga hydrogenitolerans (strain DSM 16785 / JCM 12826 / AT1271) TaxID=1122195 RepID=A0A1M4ZEG9_MARH1|nr:hypothetical protein [Marinitoga hydrogenitolerans]SHF16459.1 Chromosome segregation ATPase [Marinitoga hydrogenitolerans DSM 16785]